MVQVRDKIVYVQRQQLVKNNQLIFAINVFLVCSRFLISFVLYLLFTVLLGLPVNEPFTVNLQECITLERDSFTNSIVWKSSSLRS